MEVMKSLTLFFFACMLLMHVACIEPKKAVAPVAEQNEGPKLLFINLIFQKTPDGKDSCDVLNTIVTDGTLRDAETHPVRNKENYYTLFFHSCNGKTVYQEEIDNQLDTQMEVYNENGMIELKNTSFKQREYSIRMQKAKERICRLIVTKTVKGKTETICNHLITL